MPETSVDLDRFMHCTFYSFLALTNRTYRVEESREDTWILYCNKYKLNGLKYVKMLCSL